MHLNIEIKAKCADQDIVRKILQEQGADYKGTDHQIDVYFKVPSGRLKLRKGNIENALIYYNRENKKGPKQSDVILVKTKPDSNMEGLLKAVLGILVTVDKQREIYFIDNVKFHIDKVKGLGNFIEIEAIDTGGFTNKKLLEQCKHYIGLFGIKEEELLTNSYSDMLLNLNPK